MSNLLILYKQKIIPEIKNIFFLKSIMEVSQIKKIIINVGLGKHIGNKKIFDSVFNNIFLITNQKPLVTRVKKSISSFKIRKGMAIGIKVTLRNFSMWNFLEKLIKIIIPRISNFNGFSMKSFDKQGNFNFGIKDHSLFPEIVYEKIDFFHGINISIIFNKNILLQNKQILSLLFFPFKK